MSPLAALLDGKGSPRSIQGQSEQSLKTLQRGPFSSRIIRFGRSSSPRSRASAARSAQIHPPDAGKAEESHAQWTGKLPSRLHVISNELPKLGDASTAIVGRIVLLLLSRSWLGKEDHGLERKLHAELPGILNWALDGLQRLTVTNGNRFTRITAAEEAIVVMRDLASPVAAFVREQCETGSDKQVAVDELYGAFKIWAENNGHGKPTKQLFGRDLRAAVPSIRVTQPRGSDGKQYRAYSGITRREKADHEQ